MESTWICLQNSPSKLSRILTFPFSSVFQYVLVLAWWLVWEKFHCADAKKMSTNKKSKVLEFARKHSEIESKKKIWTDQLKLWMATLIFICPSSINIKVDAIIFLCINNVYNWTNTWKYGINRCKHGACPRNDHEWWLSTDVFERSYWK